MLVYLDICCLKRPFDDQSQSRIHLESEAVLGLLAAESDNLRFVRSAALHLENRQNPVAERASRVEQWLTGQPMWTGNAAEIEIRTTELIKMGFKAFDAIHVASAELAGAEVFACCDDRLVAVAARNRERIRVRVLQVLQMAREVLK
jgi:hypothetical protein